MKTRRVLMIVLLGFLATGAGRARNGTEVRASGGLSNYGFGDCGGWAYRVPDKPIGIKASHAFETGVVAVVEGGLSSGTIESVTYEGTKPEAERPSPEYMEGVGVRTFSAALRAGWQFKYGGVEAGPLVIASSGSRCDFDPGDEDPCGTHVLPSAELWAGHPDWGYGWAKVASGAPVAMGNIERIGATAVGIGKRTDDYRVELGYGTSGVLLEGDAFLFNRLILGTSLHFQDADDWAALGSVGVHFGD